MQWRTQEPRSAESTFSKASMIHDAGNLSPAYTSDQIEELNKLELDSGNAQLLSPLSIVRPYQRPVHRGVREEYPRPRAGTADTETLGYQVPQAESEAESNFEYLRDASRPPLWPPTPNPSAAYPRSSSQTYRQHMAELRSLHSATNVLDEPAPRRSAFDHVRRHTLSRENDRSETPMTAMKGLVQRLRTRISIADGEQIMSLRDLYKSQLKIEQTTEEKHKVEVAKARLEVQKLVWMCLFMSLIILILAYLLWVHHNGPEFAYLRQQRIEKLGLRLAVHDDWVD